MFHTYRDFSVSPDFMVRAGREVAETANAQVEELCHPDHQPSSGPRMTQAKSAIQSWASPDLPPVPGASLEAGDTR